MKKVFYIGVAGIVLFEILRVYFIMPMPGSQKMNSLDLAYFLHAYRWYFRLGFGFLLLTAIPKTFQSDRKWIPALALVLSIGVIYAFNFILSADAMFKRPENLRFSQRSENILGDSSVVLGVEYNGEAKAYPLRYIVYHHQVQDVIGGKPMLITYCSVCRTGRVFEPVINNKTEKFRLVGMDHFNAMFEDESTKSWWRQVNGEAVAGPLKGTTLPEMESVQMTLAKWFELYPDGLVMQPDSVFSESYDSIGKFERGKSLGKLTRTDTLSWETKSWVVGISLGAESKAYDWNQLTDLRIINDVVGGVPIVLALAVDEHSFVAFERPDQEPFILRNDTLVRIAQFYDFSGRNVSQPSDRLKAIKAYQEFWHSRQTFHPDTRQYP